MQDALERARAEAKNVAAQLEAERSKSAGLLDEVAQWRDEYTKVGGQGTSASSWVGRGRKGKGYGTKTEGG